VGPFTPDPEAVKLSKAAVFLQPTDVTVRFSNFPSSPNAPENSVASNPRGFALKFGAAGNSDLDIVTHSFNGFPAKTALEFAELLEAIKASGPSAAKPTALDKLLAARPYAADFLTKQKTPASFATTLFFGVNSFRFLNADSKATIVRYRFVPAEKEHYLSAEDVQAQASDYLRADITARIAKGHVKFTWLAQVASEIDKIDDPSTPFPDDRPLIKLGTVDLTALASDQEGLDKSLLFLPSKIPDGIEPADPMIAVRGAAYPVSFGERQWLTKLLRVRRASAT
jgi:catalase